MIPITPRTKKRYTRVDKRTGCLATCDRCMAQPVEIGATVMATGDGPDDWPHLYRRTRKGWQRFLPFIGRWSECYVEWSHLWSPRPATPGERAIAAGVES